MDILFDLDGTLTDSGRGITLCIQHALRGLGRPVPAADALRRYLGPPLRDSFVDLLGTQDDAALWDAIRLYRERFTSAGMFENEVYPGVAAGLADLRSDGHRLWVVTSKPQVFAARILEHFGLEGWFERVHGPELSRPNADKASLVRELLEQEKAIDRGDACMVGDRIHDVEGARANGLAAVAVVWGYASEAELAAARPDKLVRSMGELRAYAVERRRAAR